MTTSEDWEHPGNQQPIPRPAPSRLFDWTRASRPSPCRVCGKPDWCVVAGTLALCMRVPSDRPSRGDAGGWLHAVEGPAANGRPGWQARRLIVSSYDSRPDFERIARQFTDAVTERRLEPLATRLGISDTSLRATRIGWCDERRAWSWPMHNGHGAVIGIRLRDARTGAKYAIRGSRQGVFLTDLPNLDSTELLPITEGPTDLAAAVELGFGGVGRPSCSGSSKPLVHLARGRHVVVIADRDVAGQRGARALAIALLPTVRSVRIVTPPPPHKDLRAWLIDGATPSDLQSLIDASPARRITLRISP